MDETLSKSDAPPDVVDNAFAASQVAELAAPAADETYHLARRLPLAGRTSVETMVRAIWETYGLKDSARFWLWLSVLLAVVLYALFAAWNWWWPTILILLAAAIVFFGLYVPSRLVHHVRRSAEPVDRLCRGEVTDESLEYESQNPEDQWVASMSGERLIPWSELKLTKLGSDYLFFLRRKEEQRWMLILPRQLFRDERDWNEMVEFAERRLLPSLLRPRCRKCQRVFARSELRPMPAALRLIFAQPFTALGSLLGMPASRYCSGCWTTVYMRQVAFLIAALVVIMGLVGAVVYLAM